MYIYAYTQDGIVIKSTCIGFQLLMALEVHFSSEVYYVAYKEAI